MGGTDGARVQLDKRELRLDERHAHLCDGVLLDELLQLRLHARHAHLRPVDSDGAAAHLEVDLVLRRKHPKPGREDGGNLGRHLHLPAALGVLLDPGLRFRARAAQNRRRSGKQDHRRALLQREQGGRDEALQLKEQSALAPVQQRHLERRAVERRLGRAPLREEVLHLDLRGEVALAAENDAVRKRFEEDGDAEARLEPRQQPLVLQARAREELGVLLEQHRLLALVLPTQRRHLGHRRLDVLPPPADGHRGADAEEGGPDWDVRR
mmetsp:Transcript_22930/g.72115  ORF Transcript_22930/g.72115 Transcript_22930/m.72115 type:complete len:267 (-) Transcript_22930:1898-2698(-)